jgi:polysaccharide pyruvyl transferase WcaK-like protein
MMSAQGGAMRITVLGNFSGRNAGDNAILGNLVRDVAAAMPQARFIVPTLNPAAVRRICRGYDVKPLGLMPWNGAMKILGLGTLRAMVQTDCVLVTDNILFDKSFYNPLFNYLSTIALFAPLAQRRRIPIILYNASVGPIVTPIGAKALQRVLKGSPLAILRDRASVDLITKKVPSRPELILAADCALNTVPPPAEKIRALGSSLGILADGRPKLALNVNSYVDAWKTDGGSMARTGFVTEIAATFDELVREFDAQPVFFVTQTMDTGVTESIRSAMVTGRNAPMAVVGASCNYQELTGLLSTMDMLIAMRTHALILATSVHTPALNLNTYPKSAAYMETIGQGRWSLNIEDFSRQALATLARSGWQARSATRAELEKRVPVEKSKAAFSAQRLRDLFAAAVVRHREVTNATG